MALKDWKKSGNEWFYHGPNSEFANSVQKIYVDHFVPSKGWRFFIVAKYHWDNAEYYYKTKAGAMKAAKDYMRADR